VTRTYASSGHDGSGAGGWGQGKSSKWVKSVKPIFTLVEHPQQGKPAALVAIFIVSHALPA
jgi:hypothetical protein